MMQLRLVVLTLAAVMVSSFTPSLFAATDSNEHVNIAPFGTAWVVDGAGHRSWAAALTDERTDAKIDLTPAGAVEIEWREPRDVESVVVRGDAIDPSKTVMAYWSHVWPDNGTGGWQRLDDPFNGRWLAVKSRPTAFDGGVRLEFEKLMREENPSVTQKTGGVPFRPTYKLRITFQRNPTPRPG